MANYKVTDMELTSVANAIRTKGGTQASLEFPTGFVTAIENIPTGHEPVLQSKTATENGTVTPDQGYDGLGSVVVNVAGSGLDAMEPLERMHTASRIQSGTWYGSADDGDNVIEVYSVDPTHKYLYVLGETVQIANLCYSYFDPRTVTSGTRNLRNINSVSNPSKRMATNVEPPTDFIYFVAQIAKTAQYSNIRGYLYDITDLTGTVS